MAHITIEYIILLPVLLLQILLFPLAVSWLMNIWVDSRRTLALQEAASYIGSSIQQVYSILNHTTVLVGANHKMEQKLDVPPFIEGYPYTGNATLKTVLNATSSKVLEITLRLSTVGTTVKTTVILGQNVIWREESTFVSNSTNARIIAEKFANETITLYFGEEA